MTVRLNLPFPEDRLFALNILLPFTVRRGVKMREGSETMETVFTSLFFNAYICSYSEMLDKMDARVGGFVRRHLLGSIFQADEDEAQLRFDVFNLQFDRNDEGIRETAMMSADDGRNYFTAAIEGRDADDSATHALFLMVRTRKRFDPIKLPE